MKRYIDKQSKNKIKMFFVVFALMYLYLRGYGSFINSSGDAKETWKVAKTFFSSSPESSYVMYKGLWSFIPSVFSYNMEKAFGLAEFEIYRMLSAGSFAYITCIGIPNFWVMVARKPISNLNVLLFVLAVFVFLREPFTFISVDVMCVVILIMALNKTIKLDSTRPLRERITDYFLLSLFVALLSSYSGQYSPAALCIFIYLIIYLFRNFAGRDLINEIIVGTVVIMVGVLIIKLPDYWYVVNRVMPIRNSGGWLPTAKEWMTYALTSNMLVVNYPTTVLDIRGTAILMAQGANLDIIKAGGVPYDIRQHFELVFKYPVEFILRWANRLFIGVTYNQNGNSMTFLLFGYSMVFFSLKTIIDYCKKLEDIINANILIFLAWILPALVPCLMHVESRYFLGINLLLVSTTLLVSLNTSKVMGFPRVFLDSNGKKQMKRFNIMQVTIDYSWFAYPIFVIMCLMIFGALSETTGVNGDLFFKW